MMDKQFMVKVLNENGILTCDVEVFRRILKNFTLDPLEHGILTFVYLKVLASKDRVFRNIMVKELLRVQGEKV